MVLTTLPCHRRRANKGEEELRNTPGVECSTLLHISCRSAFAGRVGLRSALPQQQWQQEDVSLAQQNLSP